MTRKRYVIHPGWVVSRRDGDRHFIGYWQLVQLYRVNPAECIHADQTLGMKKKHLQAMTHLHPSVSGNYDRKDRA